MLESMYEIMMRIREIQQRFYPRRHVAISNDNRERRFTEHLSDAIQERSTETNRHSNMIRPLQLSDNDIVRRAAISDIVRNYAQQYNIPVGLINAIIEVESSFNPRAISSRGALGLMQLMPDVASALGVENPFEPEENIRAGVTLLRRLLDKYGGDYTRALAAYNAGEAAVDRSRGIPDFPETQNFVRRVLQTFSRYNE
ncbi:MAG: lytic transglycosylase domain-containing protein [Spirochaetes bacterium]|nr:lytic transglycosylase domain-containing protein [Spirochaetota bacterium]